MKVINSQPISTFGGQNFVLDYLNKINIYSSFSDYLPELGKQSKYSWKDIFGSILSIYMCGGDCIEDLQTHLKPHFRNNPYLNLSSPDTVLRRLRELSEKNNTCRTKRGTVDHTYNTNSKLEQLNISLLNRIGAFKSEELTLDYDNTILYNEKKDSKMTYKRNPGYQPGVCTLNEEHILYIENRNGNSDAKSFQANTLKRLFNLLQGNNIKTVDHFRADAASYQYDIVKLLTSKVKHFYIGCRNSYVEKYFTQATNWEKIVDSCNQPIEVGEINIIPFQKQAKDQGKKPLTYRLIIKRKLKKDAQLDVFTQDTYEYRAILTNNNNLTATEIALFYNHRGNMEKQFDILKNDFGWNKMPFSKLEQNTVFLYFTAICRNLYKKIICYFSKKVKFLKSSYRVKKFMFRFICIPAKWVKSGRQYKLRVYTSIAIKT